MPKPARQLKDLLSIGPAMLRDFELLGIRTMTDLARQKPENMYVKLGRIARQHQDICVLDTFRAAVAQAKNPRLPAEKCPWWYWSARRKKRKISPQRTPRTQSRLSSQKSKTVR